MSIDRALVWLRRDLRLDDNTALAQACTASKEVVIAFVLDPNELRATTTGAPIVQLFFDALSGLRSRLRELGSDLILLEGAHETELLSLATRLSCHTLFFNRDTDPRAQERDQRVSKAFIARGYRVVSSHDLTVFAADEIRQNDGKAYAVFTPYKRRWLARFEEDARLPVASRHLLPRRLLPRAHLGETLPLPPMEQYGHLRSTRYESGDESVATSLLTQFVDETIASYSEQRNYPAIAGTSRLSPHLRAGTIGIRTCVEAARQAQDGARSDEARKGCETWISELIWREFYHAILIEEPRIVHEAFDRRAAALPWRESETDFTAWCQGRTGYPLVDAAMRELTSTGWMHNRLRMVVAAFLTKDLLIDYRRGEAFFLHWLIDGDLAANNGGWQWSASTGTDAAPYFRIFNPVTQSRTFDPQGTYIRRYVPELAALPDTAIHAPRDHPDALAAVGITLGREYPLPIVDHAAARARALAAYAPVLKKSPSRDLTDVA